MPAATRLPVASRGRQAGGAPCIRRCGKCRGYVAEHDRIFAIRAGGVELEHLPCRNPRLVGAAKQHQRRGLQELRDAEGGNGIRRRAAPHRAPRRGSRASARSRNGIAGAAVSWCATEASLRRDSARASLRSARVADQSSDFIDARLRRKTAIEFLGSLRRVGLGGFLRLGVPVGRTLRRRRSGLMNRRCGGGRRDVRYAAHHPFLGW